MGIMSPNQPTQRGEGTILWGGGWVGSGPYIGPLLNAYSTPYIGLLLTSFEFQVLITSGSVANFYGDRPNFRYSFPMRR